MIALDLASSRHKTQLDPAVLAGKIPKTRPYQLKFHNMKCYFYEDDWSTCLNTIASKKKDCICQRNRDGFKYY